jgi:tripartite-type tricarboxylate transporter receptor subunit TctC
LIALARTKPGRLAFASPGVGGLQHLTIEMLNSAAKIKVEHVPYKGTGPAMTDVLGGHIDGVVAGVSGILGSVKAGKLRAVALTGSERSSSLPELPPALANTLHASIVKAVHSPAIAEKLVAAGVDPKTDASPAAFAQFVRDDFVRWGKIVKDSGIKAE